MTVTETIHCLGHQYVLATHKTTFEVTTEPSLTLQGDCIIGVGADRAGPDLSPAFREALAAEGAVLITTLACDGISVIVRSRGGPGLDLSHPTDLVWRRSPFTCSRTIGVYADHVARTLPKDLIARLQAGAPLEVTLAVLSAEEAAAQSCPS
ncbi:DUF371 domain-containing protein [Methanosphaerula subterraneus]|uniref:DUF371 domain-containing protein n=1 Tax=Methanosphaerula subterraneus TaxID=3350244 RepID=UPI003F82802E